MLRKIRRFIQKLGGRSCLSSNSVWVDIILFVTFFTLLSTFILQQKERSFKLKHLQKHGAIAFMQADGKMVKVDVDGGAWKDSVKKPDLLAMGNAPSGEIGNAAAPGRMYKNISEMADLVKDKNILSNIQTILGDIPQSFGSVCDNIFYPDSHQFPASIIIVFMDQQLYDLKVTLSSIQVNTPDVLIEEIIVVDDASTEPRIVKEANNYVRKIPKAQLIRNPKRLGEARSRLLASQRVKGRNIVFISTTVVVAPGWLEPLNHHLFQQPLSLLMPHLDKLFDPYKYETVRRTWIPKFSWSLVTQMQKIDQPEDTNMKNGVNSPFLKGDIYATTRSFLKKYGLYDLKLADSGAEHLELSLRAWMCGAAVKVIRCSHVGILNMAEPTSVEDAFAAWRVAQLWMSDYVSLVSQQSDLHHNPSADDIAAIQVRKHKLNATGTCQHDFGWYMNNVVKANSLPSKNTKVVGMLKVHNGFCAHLLNVTRLELAFCHPEKYGAINMMFEYTDIGQIKLNGKCVTSLNNFAYVLPCATTDNDNQIWKKAADGTYREKKEGLCLMHVTDPLMRRNGEIIQTIMTQKCSKDQTEFKNFSAFYFVKPGE